MNFIFLPTCIIEFPLPAQIVLAHIISHRNKKSGVAFMEVDTLASECKMNKANVIQSIKILKEKELINVQPRTKVRCDGSKQKTSNLYCMPWFPTDQPITIPKFKVPRVALRCSHSAQILCFFLHAENKKEKQATNKTLQDHIQRSESTVRRVAKELEKMGIIDIRPEYNQSNSTEQEGNTYILRVNSVCNATPYHDKTTPPFTTRTSPPSPEGTKQRKKNNNIFFTSSTKNEKFDSRYTDEELDEEAAITCDRVINLYLPRHFEEQKLKCDETLFLLLSRALHSLCHQPHGAQFKNVHLTQEDIRQFIENEPEAAFYNYILNQYSDYAQKETIRSPIGVMTNTIVFCILNYYADIEQQVNRWWNGE